MRRLPAVLALALSLALVAAAAAAAAQPRTTLSDVEDEVMCDTCNVPLNVADSPRADQERRGIRDLIARGLAQKQIKGELRRRDGPPGLAPPPRPRLRPAPP